ncbi:hypothetical protein QBC45DRAFT_435275 [Copromyces sp. CBS 386.78]|nr:hypothetical protein QBC45DRAFT_435275 [Copromyces sp. CBS 386.78]
MFWAARWGCLRTLQLPHAAGANLKQAWTQRVPPMGTTEDVQIDERTALIYKEMGRHNAAPYVRPFQDSVSESLVNTENDDSSSTEGDDSEYDSNNDSDDDQCSVWCKLWEDDPDNTKTAAENISYTFPNFILKPQFSLYIWRGNPYPMYWWHPWSWRSNSVT